MALSSNPAWTRKDIANLTKAGYQNCSTVYACVNLIVEAAAAVPWSLYKRPSEAGGKTEKVESHELLELLRRPNDQEGGAAFIKNTLAFYLIGGNSYMIKAGPITGPPDELYLLRPDRVTIIKGNKFIPIVGYRYTVNGQAYKPDFKAAEVLHLKAFNPLDDSYGLSPIEVAGKEIDIASMGRDWNMKMLQNDAVPPGALTTEASLEAEQRENLKKLMKEEIQGYKNASTPLVLEGGFKWQTFAITPRDMNWLQSDKMTTRKICSVYKVAPELIGDASSKTFSNYKEARKALYMEAIIPLLAYLRDELNVWLTPMWGDLKVTRLYLDFDKNSIEAIKEELDAVYKRQGLAWWRSINERRISTGDAEIGKAGDVILIPANLIPLSDISGNISEE